MLQTWYWCRVHLRPEQEQLSAGCDRVGPLLSSDEAVAVGKVVAPSGFAILRLPVHRAILQILVDEGGEYEDDRGVANSLAPRIRVRVPKWRRPWAHNVHQYLCRLREEKFIEFGGRVPRGTTTWIRLIKPLEEVRELLQNIS